MKITIIALGRLGIQLYQKLEKEYEVIGTYHNAPKRVGKEVHFDFQKDIIPEEIQDSNVLIFNLPPSVMKGINYWKRFLNSIRAKKIIFISSSSVFGYQGHINEKTTPKPISDSGKFLLECENLLKEKYKEICIIRPTGLYDSNSHPGKFLSSRESKSAATQSVNLISISDLSDIIIKSLDDEKGLIHATNINHPSKGEYYSKYCRKRKLEPPRFIGNLNEDKVVMTNYSDYQVKTDLP